jgi:hypothetical protein
MKRASEWVIALCSAAMELAWLFAWSAFTLDLFGQPPYPAFQAAFVFVFSVGLIELRRVARWSIVRGAAVQGTWLLLLCLMTLRSVWFANLPIWRLLEVFRVRHAAAEWLTLAGFLFWTFAFWAAGTRFAQRTRSYAALCARFDAGFGWLFALLLVKWLSVGRAGLRLTEPISDALIVPYFIAAVTALALARNRASGSKVVMAGYRGVGSAVSFCLLVVASGAFVGLVFLPLLSVLAKAGYIRWVAIGAPLVTALSDTFIFIWELFLQLRMREPKNSPKSTPADTFIARNLQGQGAEAATRNALIMQSVAAVLLAIFVGVAVWYVRRWLFARVPLRDRTEGLFTRIWRWLVRWIAALQLAALQRLQSRKRHGAVRAYSALLSWGRRGGFATRADETPLEYAQRLTRHWRVLGPDIDQIIEAFHLHVYGPSQCDAATLDKTRLALKRLRSPMLWPKRMLLRFRSG